MHVLFQHRLAACATLALLAASPALAQRSTPETGRVAEGYRYGVGVGGSVLTSGLSGIYDLNDKVSVHASLGALGTVTALGAEGWYRFKQTPKYDLYGYGKGAYLGVSYLTDAYSTAGFGGGAGIEWHWGRVLNLGEDFPPLYGSASVGGLLLLNNTAGLSVVDVGGGLRYRF